MTSPREEEHRSDEADGDERVDDADQRVDDAVEQPTPLLSGEALVEHAVAGLVQAPPGGEDEHPLEALLGRYGRVALPLVIVGGGAAAGHFYGPPGVVLVLAATALVAVIALFWQSLRTALGETPLSGADAYALGAPRMEEEQKRSVLRALKDLEFERSVGKISESDYRTLVTQYRAEAKRLLRLIDERNAPQRQRAEALVAQRLAALGLATEAAREAAAARKAPASQSAQETEASEPEASEPEADGPEASEPEAGEPEAGEPEAKADESETQSDDATEKEEKADA